MVLYTVLVSSCAPCTRSTFSSQVKRSGGLSGTFSNLIREVFSYWFVRALLYPKMTPRTYNLFTVFVVFKRRKKRKGEVRTRRRQREDFGKWMGLCTPPPAGERGRKKGSLPSESSSNGLSRTAPRAEKRETHISRHVLCVCTVIHPSHRSRSPFSLSFHPNKKFALCASKSHHSSSSKRTPKRTTRRETRNATASLLKPIINNA